VLKKWILLFYQFLCYIYMCVCVCVMYGWMEINMYISISRSIYIRSSCRIVPKQDTIYSTIYYYFFFIVDILIIFFSSCNISTYVINCVIYNFNLYGVRTWRHFGFLDLFREGTKRTHITHFTRKNMEIKLILIHL
jgi:hypothetical protein